MGAHFIPHRIVDLADVDATTIGEGKTVQYTGGKFIARAAAPPLVMPTPGRDALAAKSVAELRDYLGWLTANNVPGEVGEIGWPHDESTFNPGVNEWPQWRQWGEAVWEVLEAAGVPVLWWNAAEMANNQTLCAYGPSADSGPIDTVNHTGFQLEAHLRPTVGISAGNGASSGPTFYTTQATAPDYSNTREPRPFATPARTGTYGYGSQDTFKFLASRGVKTVRMSFRWERVQRSINGALDATEMGRLDQAIQWCADVGIGVVLCCHSFGAYYLDDGTQGVKQIIGSTAVPATAFNDLWTKLSTRYKNNAAVVGYDLMNEPANLSTANWHTYSQGALNAIRANSDNKLVIVEGGSYAGAQGWTSREGAPWITDSANNYRYSAHFYPDGSGTYDSSYAFWLSNAQSKGFDATSLKHPKWAQTASVQTTVGNAGAASAPPSAPAKWLKITGPDGLAYVVPAYKAQLYRDLILATANLKAYYRLGETSGTQATDSSPAPLHGTYTNAPTLGVAGLLLGDADKAAQFDGVNDYVDLPFILNVGVTDWTIELWSKPSGLAANSTIVAQRDGTGTGHGLLFIDSVSSQLASAPNGVTQKSGFTPVINQVIHVALVYNSAGDSLQWYINGKAYALNSSVVADSATGGWVLGTNKTLAGPFYAGVLDEVAIYSRQLQAPDFQLRYALGS